MLRGYFPGCCCSTWILYSETLELVQTMVEVIGRQGVVFSDEYLLDSLRSFTSLTPHFCLHSFLCSSNCFTHSLELVSDGLCSLEWVSWCLEEHFSAIYCWLRLGTCCTVLLGSSWPNTCCCAEKYPSMLITFFGSLSLLKNYLFLFYVYESICLHVCLCTMCVHCTQKRASDQLELDLQLWGLCECWGLKWSHTEEQQVPSLQPCHFFFFEKIHSDWVRWWNLALICLMNKSIEHLKVFTTH